MKLLKKKRFICVLWRLTLVILLSSFLIPKSCFSQSKAEISQYYNLFDKPSDKHKWDFVKQNNSNEFHQLFSAMFLLYKELLSSQDAASCIFTPSCSVYAIESIKKKGIVVGLMAAFDRLCRCNSFSRDNYPLHPKLHLLHDPVN